jgi:hypothetical protein
VLSIPLDVAHVADGVSQRERVAEGAEDSDGFHVVMEGSVQIPEVSLDLAQPGKRPCQQCLIVGFAADCDRSPKQAFRICQTVFSPCLVALMQE